MPASKKQLRLVRHGASAILIMAMIVPLIIISFFALSLANLERNEVATQVSSDLAAMWGANAISREVSLVTIEDRARALALDNWQHGSITSTGKKLDTNQAEVQIEFGTTRFFNHIADFTPGDLPVNSIRVGTEVPSGIIVFGQPLRALLVNGKATVANVERDICLVVDRSGSMTFDLTTDWWHQSKEWHPENKMANSSDPYLQDRCNQWWWAWPHPENSRWSDMMPAIYALAAEIPNTQQHELFSIVSYSSAVTEYRYDHSLVRRQFTTTSSSVESQPSYNYLEAVQKLDNKYKFEFPIMGGTNIAAGIDLGAQVLLGNSSRPYAFKTMILMTDGQYNVGREPWLAARDAAEQGIEVFTITFSNGAEIDAMVLTAKEGRGKHFHAATGEELRSIFIEIANTPPGVFVE